MLVSIRKVLTIFKFRKQSTCNRAGILSNRMKMKEFSFLRLIWTFMTFSLHFVNETIENFWKNLDSSVFLNCQMEMQYFYSFTDYHTQWTSTLSVPGWEKTKSFVDFPYFMCKSSKSICIIFFSLALHPHDQQTFLFDWMQITRKTEIEFCLAVHATNSIWVVHLIAAKIESFYYLSSTDVYNII